MGGSRLSRRSLYAAGIVAVAMLLLLGIAFVSESSAARLCADAPNVSLCQYRSVEAYLAQDDIPDAMSAIASFAESDKDSYTCHSLMHLVGQAVYKDYEQGIPFTATEKTSICSYGFFHGFMESLLAATHSFKEATVVCKGGGSTPFNIPRAECFHGIGHGMVDRHIPEEWKHVPTILAQSSELCRKVMDTQNDFDKCMGGVYNGIANAYWQREYGLQLDPADTFSLCRTAAINRNDCYTYMARVLLNMPEFSFASAVRFIQTSVPDTYQYSAISGLAIMSSPRTNDQPGLVETCESLEPRLRVGCITGLAQGIMYSGDVQMKKKGAAALCARANDEGVRTECISAVSDLESK